MTPSAANGYELREEVPSVPDYVRLRRITGLSPKSDAAAAVGLPRTWYGVSVLRGDEVVGMGRIIGDGGCFFQIVDVAVAPGHQGRGLGRLIMEALMRHLRANAPPTAHVSLLADGDAWRLYERFGFRLTEPYSRGMILRL